MEVNKVIYNGRTLVDLTNDTVTPETLASGATAHDASGVKVTGTMPTTSVLYTAQNLTAAQKAQAKENIGISDATTSVAGLMSTADKTKLDNTNIAYGTCSTAAGTAEKAVVLSGNTKWSLKTGSIIMVKFDVSNTASNVTLNVNGTGAYPIWYNNAEYASNGTAYTGYAKRTITYMFNGTHYVWITASYDANSTYTNASLGQGYATCSTAAATTAKVGSLSSYKLVTGGIVSVKFTNAVPANATLNVNSTGAKSIYFRGAKITADVIKAGDTATFVYSSYYHLISIDRWQNDIADIKEAIARSAATPQAYGAKGDGTTDDTTAFQNALANNRTVFVPGGTYKLSGELVIRGNCQLELAQDAVLNFTQTSGNCISMKMSANIVGNHATISVPYSFSGKVINIDGGLDTSVKDVPPFIQWDPMWKTARYITDLNIVKPDTRGFYYSMDGKCSGIAVYLCADYSDVSTFIWAADLSRLRISGAFTYGIFAESFQSGEDGWIHQLRLDGFVDGAEVALYFKNITLAYAAVKVLPRRAYTTSGEYITYAKWGICLENSRHINLLGSRVMDWDSIHSLWTEGGINQHIALLGNCLDVKIDDYRYYDSPSYDVRSRIYTDTPSNLESLTILEEPFTRWFKPVDSKPYFNDGDFLKRLVLEEELKECIDSERIANFTNALPSAINKDGTVFNGNGFAKHGMCWDFDNNGVLNTDAVYHGCTGLIKVKQGDTIYAKALSYAQGDNYCGVITFDSNLEKIVHATREQLMANTLSYFFDYAETEDVFTLTIKQRSTTAYVAFNFHRTQIGVNPVISVNNPITYTQSGYLQDGIKVKPENVEGLSEILGSYINDIDALLGGG